MAIQLTESYFTDIYGNSTNQFKANAGDTITITQFFETEISFITTAENSLRIDKLQNKVTRGSGSFLDDGFRTGARYVLYIVNNNNNNHEIWAGTITSVTDKVATLDTLPDRNNWTSGSDYTCVLKTNQAYPLSEYQSVEFAFNFIDNDVPKETPVALESIIDGETSRFGATDLHTMSIGQVKPMYQNGKKSGNFDVENCFIQRVADKVNPYTSFNSIRRRYAIQLTIVVPFMFSEDSFIGALCLKYVSKSSFKVISTETLAPTIVEYNQNANTGLFNEGFNSDEANSKQSSSVSELYFNRNNIFSFTISCPTSLNLTAFELGAMYLTQDADYNLNKDESQDYYLPVLKTGLINATNITDQFFSTSKQFAIILNNVSYVDLNGLRTFTIEVTLAPFYTNNGYFGQFIESRGELDRRFLFWCKLGNTNRLIYDSQILYEQPVGEFFEPEEFGLMNHDKTFDFTDVSLNPSLYFDDDFNVEDDILFVADIMLDKNDDNEGITAKVVVRNSIDLTEFVLDKVSFDLTNQDLDFFINQTIAMPNNLPISNKNNSQLLKKQNVEDFLFVRLIYPVVIDWRYWEEVFQTHPFFVSQNKNNNLWYNYRSNPWKVFIKIEKKRNGVVDYFYEELYFKIYDDWAGTSNIELFNTTETIQYNSLPENSTVLIKATHTFPNAYSGNPWGMITIEPKESSPRYIMSTEVNRSQPENPMVGILNPNRCDIQFLNSTTIILRCYVNTNLLNGKEFCISSKISEAGIPNPPSDTNKLTSEDGQDKITSGTIPEFKIIS